MIDNQEIFIDDIARKVISTMCVAISSVDKILIEYKTTGNVKFTFVNEIQVNATRQLLEITIKDLEAVSRYRRGPGR
ncbi:hypothetical protein C0J52_28110 [Blattella germanica]|nr:hypothetical protein C0J52_28110 [Blattella germanica]